MKIYFDMDGVLADFQKYFKQHYPEIVDPWDLTDEEFWPKVKAIPDFWENLPVLEGALELFEYAKQNHEVEILSSPSSHDHRSYGGKIKWVEKHLGEDIRVNLVTRKHKQKFAEEDSVLIDDIEKTCKEFEQKKGLSIVFKTAQQALNELKSF